MKMGLPEDITHHGSLSSVQSWTARNVVTARLRRAELAQVEGYDEIHVETKAETGTYLSLGIKGLKEEITELQDKLNGHNQTASKGHSPRRTRRRR